MSSYTAVECRDVLQRTDIHGPRISQIQVIEINGELYELPIWSDEKGNILWHLGEPVKVATQ